VPRPPVAPRPAGPVTASRAPVLAAAGTFLALLPLYGLVSAGRIDITDGQVRYEVARSWLETGRPAVRDERLIPLWLVIKTDRGAYGGYNAGASVAGMPAMLLSRLLPGHQAERDRFAFAMTGPVFGAAGMALLVLAYSMLGLSAGHAVAWALVVALATLWWPASETVFDQNQHAVFLLAALLLAWQSGRRQRWWPAGLGGLAGGCLLNYQENYALLLPLVGLAVFASRDEGTASVAPGLRRGVDRDGIARYLLFGAVSAAGLLPLVGFNYLRFGAPFYEGRLDHPLLFAGANPLAGFLSLAVSPGKGVFLFSPPLLLAFLGARSLLRRAPALVAAIAAVSIIHVMIVVQVAFFGGDWCWGPRYLLILIPLWALTLPFAAARVRREVVVLLVAAGVVVQLMAVTVDHQRFFFERNLPPTFWADAPWFYFRDSQLVARAREIAVTLRDGMPREAASFTPSPGREATYSPFGPAAPAMGARWMRQFKVFYLPRPWPFWVSEVPAERRPVAVVPGALLAAVSLGMGLALLRRALRGAPPGASADIAPAAPQAPAIAPAAEQGARPRIVVAAGCVALLAIPFLAVQFPPVADLPQHLGQVQLFEEAFSDPGGRYRIQWLTPYGLSYALLGAAWAALPPEAAGRAGMILLAVLWTVAAHLLAARAGRPAASGVLASLLFFNHTIYWGFYSFAFGWPVFVAWLVLTTRRLHAPARWVDVPLYLAGAAALYLSHALWFAAGAAWLVVASLVLRAPLRPTLVRLASFSPVLVVAAIWYPRLSAAGFDSPTRWFYPPSARLSGSRVVDSVLGGLRGPTEWVVVAVLAAWVAAALWQHRRALARAVDRPLALAAGFLFTLALFLPDQYSNTIFFASRWAPPAAVLLVLAVPAPAFAPALRLAAASLVALAFVAATTASWLQVEEIEYSGFRAALDAVPPRARVLGLDFVKVSEIVKGRPFLQSFAYAQVYRGADLNFSFAEFAPSPVVYRERRRVPWTRGLEWFAERAQPGDLAFFDYVLVNADPAQHARMLALASNLTPATGTGRWRLYRLSRERP